MSYGILIGNNSLLPDIGQIPNGNIVSCTEIFRCHEYKTDNDIIMYVGSKNTGVYVVSYTITPDVSGDIDRRWLFYSNNEYLAVLGSNVEKGIVYYSENSEYHTNYYYGTIGSQLGNVSNLIYNSNIHNYASLDDALTGEGIIEYGVYPITYNATNCTMSGPTEASGGTEVVVNVTPSSGYILRSSGVSVIDSTGVTVPHIVQGNQIAFTMPYAP